MLNLAATIPVWQYLIEVSFVGVKLYLYFNIKLCICTGPFSASKIPRFSKSYDKISDDKTMPKLQMKIMKTAKKKAEHQTVWVGQTYLVRVKSFFFMSWNVGLSSGFSLQHSLAISKISRYELTSPKDGRQGFGRIAWICSMVSAITELYLSTLLNTFIRIKYHIYSRNSLGLFPKAIFFYFLLLLSK